MGAVWLHETTAPLDRFDAHITSLVVSARTGWLDTLARLLNGLGSRGGVALVGLATVALALDIDSGVT